MAEVRVIEAEDQDGTQLWQHDGCWGVQSAKQLGGQDVVPKKCPLCGMRGGTWYPLYRPSGPQEIKLIEHREAKIEEAARDAVKNLNRALGGV